MVAKMVKFCKRYSTTMSDVIPDRTIVRHRMNHPTDRDKMCVRIGRFRSPGKGRIERMDTDGALKMYWTPTDFANWHYVDRRPDRVYNCNGWKEVEALINGKWVSLMTLRSNSVQTTKSTASSKA
jgi:hypothetical protein